MKNAQQTVALMPQRPEVSLAFRVDTERHRTQRSRTINWFLIFITILGHDFAGFLHPFVAGK
jgi:hypothetical protein